MNLRSPRKIQLFRKVLFTWWRRGLACAWLGAHRAPLLQAGAAGTEARPTGFFHKLWVGHRAMRNCHIIYGT